MTTVLLDDSNLVAIGNAIREKNNSTDKYKPREMAAAIHAIEGKDPNCNGLHVPDEALHLTGDCDSKFAKNVMNWLIEVAGDRMTTKDLTYTANMFNSADKLKSIPFDFNYVTPTETDTKCMFQGCSSLTEIGAINGLMPLEMSQMFSGCSNLRYLPEFNNCDFSRFHENTSCWQYWMFDNCRSLRSIPEDLLKQIHTPLTAPYGAYPYCMFRWCASLDEIRGLSPQSGTFTSNAFENTFYYCYRLKEVIFDTQEDGTPYEAPWSNQTINLASNIGYAHSGYEYMIYDYNSGITKDKKVTDDATYAALKNDPDWYTTDIAYSRYNHDSAVNTINSLPIVSGTGCTIKFEGAAGSATDGGAINILTEEEIAVATARGWTVTLA